MPNKERHYCTGNNFGGELLTVLGEIFGKIMFCNGNKRKSDTSRTTLEMYHLLN